MSKQIDSVFDGAGAKPGLEIWCVEKQLRLVPVPKSLHGKFYSGNSYVVLSTVLPRSGPPQHDIHYWLGKDANEVESTLASDKALELDSALGSCTVQYREVQGQETEKFLSYFKPCVIPIEGVFSSDSGQLNGESYKISLLTCKGEHVVSVKEVPFSRSSLNHNDVFILDTASKIFLFSGCNSSTQERAKALEVVQYIKENKHGGTCEVATVEDGKLVGDPEVGEFWSFFGGYAPIPRDSPCVEKQSDSPFSQLFWITAQAKLCPCIHPPTRLKLSFLFSVFSISFNQQIKMGLSKKLSRKSSRDSDDFKEFDDMESEQLLTTMEDYDDDREDDEDEEDEEEEDGEEEEEDEDEEDGEEGEEQEEEDEESGKDGEMEDLEKEYMNLRNQEQDIWKNLKRHKDEDLIKGQAVKNQKVLWDKTLEFRFLLQKAFANSNRLPQEPVRSSFCDSDEVVGMAYADVITSSKKTLESLLELQEALLEKNPSISQSSNGDSGQVTKKHSKDSTNSDAEEDIDWLRISEMQKRIAPFRNKSIDKWQRKTQVTTGAAAMTGKLQAFNQNISEQVAAYMRDPTKMVRQMQQRRSTIGVFGAVPELASNARGEESCPDGDPELLNDTEFYQQLLKEFLENVDPSSTEATFYALKRLQTKKRKIVDRRASKSRKIRYNVHEKIVNFMAPQPMNIPPMAPKVFENLFGLKTQKPAVDS